MKAERFEKHRKPKRPAVDWDAPNWNDGKPPPATAPSSRAQAKKQGPAGGSHGDGDDSTITSRKVRTLFSSGPEETSRSFVTVTSTNSYESRLTFKVLRERLTAKSNTRRGVLKKVRHTYSLTHSPTHSPTHSLVVVLWL